MESAAGLGFGPGGRPQALRVPWHRVVALSGAPNWDCGHRTPDLRQRYKPIDAPPPPPILPAGPRGAGLRAVPTPDGAA